MAEWIGKYEVVERIARGGMGLIFRARDPVLDRLVALKVLSGVEVTSELRARFFREAQACARLSHPNIVTIHDMGEDDGRLFIVMELLEGEDLRRLIARQAPLAIEDKLSIMLQICDGLHYAHQKGVVHRDIKPANIVLLGTGQVKILDFGIAQIAAAQQWELTRAGMIMGTPRYMAPEQARGQADHRSDIFSVGAVSYELLSARPPFTGGDPLEILEQLRTVTPPRLCELDPSLPPALAAAVERAMLKEPGDRFADLGQMRGQLDLVQSTLADEAERVWARVLRQRETLAALHQALADRTGAVCHGDPIPAPPHEERKRLAALQALEREMIEQVQAARSRLARAAALAPVLQHAHQLLAGGQLAEAVHEFEAIVTGMPEHALAIAALSEARAKVEAQDQERRREADDRLEDTFVQTGAVAGLPSRPGAVPTELIEAEATGRTWAPRVRPIAIGAGIAAAIVIASLYWRIPATHRGPPEDARAPAESTVGAPRPTEFAAAPEKVQEGDLVRDGQDMKTADGRDREAVARPGTESQAPGTESQAPGTESQAPTTESQAPTTESQAPATESQAPTTESRAPATESRAPATESRAPATESRAPATESQAERGATAAPSGGSRDRPSLPPREDDKSGAARAGPASAPAGLEQARLRMAAAKRAAEKVGAGFFVHNLFSSAQSTEREAMAALERSDHEAAMRLFAESQSRYQVAAQEAKREEETARQLAPLKASLEQAHATVTARRQQALAAAADQLAQDVFYQAESRQVEGDGLARRQDLVAAAQAYRDAAERYGEAILRARAARGK
jgi:Protein kinase domain